MALARATFLMIMAVTMLVPGRVNAECRATKGNGKFWFWIVPLSLPTTLVQTWLPAGVSPPMVSGSEYTKVVVWLGRQMDVRVRWIPFRRWDYNEFMIFIPNVQYAGGKYNHSPLLYLDDVQAIRIGRLIGYPKYFATFGISGNSYTVFPEGQGAAVSATFHNESKYSNFREVPFFDSISSNFTNPIIQFRRHAKKLYYDWGVNPRNGSISSASATIDFHRPLLSGFPVGRYHVPALAESPDGAFKVRSNYWCLNG